MISFRKDKTIADFSNHFYLEAQILTSSGSLTMHDAHIALRVAVKPYKALYQTLMLSFQDNCTLDNIVHYSCQCDDAFGTPNLVKAPPSLQLSRTLGGSHQQQQVPAKTQYH
ncbi:hypothetical protein DSO57_1018196 [Entomophthora muscae]|uniref:Uncharacterized protein n=1 Tax=Entomophthora muscae TaxID=34485 RepID=A0ACC2RJ51_9FUNG|nr:hypothetical protein DSO57_1018196 [Entomophthora muscae]